MATNTNEISTWRDEAPVIELASSQEFDVWMNEAPVLDIDEGFDSGGITPIRRRSYIF
jgi:hypothetical protein